MEWIFADASFYKIQDWSGNPKGLFEFVDTSIRSHPNRGLLTKNLSNVYVLVALKSSILFKKDKELRCRERHRLTIKHADPPPGSRHVEPRYLTWKDVLSTEQYDLLNKNERYVIGYMLATLDNTPKNVHWIDFIDTRLRKFNLATYMIRRYEKGECIVLPHNIILSAPRFWLKFFQKKYDIESVDDLERLEIELLYPDEMNNSKDWSALKDLLEEHECKKLKI